MTRASEGRIPEWLRFADPLQSKVARWRSLVCHSGRSAGVWGAKHFAAPQLTDAMKYDHKDAEGFIRLFSLPERVRAITREGRGK